jgi:hypothetical protein
VWLALPEAGSPRLNAALPFQSSVYLDRDDERSDLVAMAATDIAAATDAADLITGHQLCSDLAVLSANAGTAGPVTSIDVEWSKNYRIKDGNRAVGELQRLRAERAVEDTPLGDLQDDRQRHRCLLGQLLDRCGSGNGEVVPSGEGHRPSGNRRIRRDRGHSTYRHGQYLLGGLRLAGREIRSGEGCRRLE